MDEDLYQSLMTRFLFSPLGSKYRFMFSYSDGEELECGEPVPKITVMISEFRHLPLSGSRSQISAMNRIKDIVSGANFTEGAHVFPFAKVYAAWETDEVTLLYSVQSCTCFFSILPSLFLSALKLCHCLFSFAWVKVIMRELYRNLLLALACVSATTLVLLSSLVGCALVIGCVALTLVNVMGFMHFWGEKYRTELKKSTHCSIIPE